MNEIVKITFFIICASHVKFIFGENLSIGDNCKNENNKTGTCMLLEHCSFAIEQIKQGINPNICAFQQREPIICCPGVLNNTEVVNNTELVNNTEERISRQKCREYGQSVFEIGDVPLILNDMSSKKVNISKCRKKEGFLIPTYIANLGEFPHMALIQYEENMEKRWLCSGVLISEQYILTTAVCAIPRYNRPNKVRLGTTHINSEDNKNYIDVNISEIIKHPDFKYPKVYNNIALLKLQHPVKLNEFIRPACLPDLNEGPKERYSFSGWNSLVDVLNNFIIEKQDDRLCKNAYNSIRLFPNGFDVNTQLCTKFDKDACDMLQGSALQTYDSKVYCMYDIQGLFSFGNGCYADNLSVYTKIASYIDWIEKIVWL